MADLKELVQQTQLFQVPAAPDTPSKNATVQAVPNAIEAAVQTKDSFPTTAEVAVKVDSVRSPPPPPPSTQAGGHPRTTAQVRFNPNSRPNARAEHPQRMVPSSLVSSHHSLHLSDDGE